jgi:predicted ATP-binding protein involved in virulence
MRIKEISLHDVRLIKDASINFDQDKNVTVLLAENGKGKTTILDSIALAVNPFIAWFPGQSLKNPIETDIRISNQSDRENYLRITATLVMGENKEILIERLRRKDQTVKPETSGVGIKELQHESELIYLKIQKEEEAVLPLIAYYGTGRGMITAPGRKRNFQRVFVRWDCYNGTTEASTNFKRFFEWYDTMEDLERRKQIEKCDLQYKLPVLDAVRRALTLMLGQKYTNPRIEVSPLRFVVDEKDENGEIKSLRIEQLSDGYRIIIAMTADIASRMAEGNPDAGDPLQLPGIVLIDEVDLHLHPSWQRTILSSLTRTFPKIQFIVTTHSPVIALGASAFSQIVVLNGNGEPSCQSGESYDTYDVGQILISDLFGLPNDRAPQWDDLIRKRNELLSIVTPSDEESKRLAELDDKLSALSYGESVNEIQARKLILDAAKLIREKNHDQNK